MAMIRLARLEETLHAQLDQLPPSVASPIKDSLESTASSTATPISLASYLADRDRGVTGQMPSFIEVVQVALLDATRAALEAEVLLPRAQNEAIHILVSVLKERHGGRTIELRIPPVAAVQVAGPSSGPIHTRGTPPNVVETTPKTFLRLAYGMVTWSQAKTDFAIQVSGSHADDVADMLPVVAYRRGSERDNSKGVT